MHSTDNLDDGYFGSGKYLWHSIGKHGKENHEIEILEHYFSREELVAREKELVNLQLLENSLCLNLQTGGEGGWNIKNIDVKTRNAKCRNRFQEKMKKDDSFAKAFAKKQSANAKDRWIDGRYDVHFGNSYWNGKTHSDETKMKIGEKNSKHQTGSGNSQFGTCWINDGYQARKIKKEDLQRWLDLGWRKGRRF